LREQDGRSNLGAWMWEALLHGLAEISVWPNPLLVVVGTLIGLIFGMIPGLSGAIAIAIMIPLTFSMDLTQSMALLLSALGGSAFGGSISAILINIPGTSVNAATTFDGYPMAQQGRAGVAIGASAAASAMGATFGLLVLVASIPVMTRMLLLFGPPEVFMLTFMGLTVIALAVEGSLIASLISGGLGLLLSFHGFIEVVGGVRFTFGSSFLWDGIPLLPVFIGLFAVSGGIELLMGGETVASPAVISQRAQHGAWRGMLSIFENWGVFLTSSIIGVIIGIIPGVGGAVSNFVAYGVAKQHSRHRESFGKGNVAGVIAPEAANDSKDGGALMPTLALGIPGSEVMAILLGAFVLHGINPGRSMFTEHLDLVWTIVLALFFSNWLTSLLGVIFANQFIRLTLVPVRLYAPPIICVSLIGAYAVQQNIIYPLLALIFGVLGFAMKRLGYSRVALVIGLMLGTGTEAAFFQSVQIARGSYWIFVQRPVSLLLLAVILVAVSLPFVREYRRRRGALPAGAR
jgi:putative tricarboxylic transport membrane protein